MPSPDQLEAALAGGRAGDISLDGVLAVLADVELYLPIDDSTSFAQRQATDGRRFVPAFATLAALRQAEPRAPYLVAAGRDLAQDWEPELWMYLNPQGRTPLMLRSDKVALLAEQPLAERPAAGAAQVQQPDAAGPGPAGIAVAVHAPRSAPPADVLHAVHTVAAEHPDVAEAYLFEARDDLRGTRLVAGLVPADDRSVRELESAVSSVHRLLPAGHDVEVMAIDRDLRDVVASSVEPL